MKYSLWNDVREARQLGKMEKDYEDERAKLEAMGVLVKARSLTNDFLLIFIVVLYVFVFHPPVESIRINVGQLDTVTGIKMVTNAIFLVIYLSEYLILLRFASKGIVRYNKAAGTAMCGLIFPIWIYNMADDIFMWYKDDSLAFPIALLVVFGAILVLYLIANGVYNRAMNEDEDEEA